MKSVLVLLFVIFVASTYGQDAAVQAQIKAAKEECIKEFDANPDIIEEVDKGVFKNVDEKAKCVVKCVMLKEGFFDDNKKFLVDVATETLSKREQNPDIEKIRKALDHCKDKTGENDCDHAYNVYNCYFTTKFA